MDALKLPQIVDFDVNDSKVKDWDNIITCHAHDNACRTWSSKNKKIGAHILISGDRTAIKTTCISSCGNFGYLGCASGAVDMFNMQSGQFRKTFSDDDGHKKPITGLTTDTINRYLISSSVDKTVKVSFGNRSVICLGVLKTKFLLYNRFGKSRRLNLYIPSNSNLLLYLCVTILITIFWPLFVMIWVSVLLISKPRRSLENSGAIETVSQIS